MGSKNVANADMANKSEPAVPEDTRDVFPFFDLPRELRDMIYDHCISDSIRLPKDRPDSDDDSDGGLNEASDEDSNEDSDEDESSDEDYECAWHAKLSIEKAPLVQLLCTNRQVKQEYEKILKDKTTLVISDNDEWELTNPDLSGIRSRKVQRVEFRFVAHCSHAEHNNDLAAEVNGFSDLINRMKGDSQLSGLKAVTLTIGVAKLDGPVPKWPEGPWSDKSDWLLAKLNDLVAIEKIVNVDVYWCAPDTLQPIESEDLWVTWTKKDGWKAPDKDGEEAASKEVS